MEAPDDIANGEWRVANKTPHSLFATHYSLLFQYRPERAVPFGAGRVGFEIGDAGQMQVVDPLARAGKLPALIDQAAGLVPLLQTERLEDVLVEGLQRSEFRTRTHQRIAQHR